MDKESLSEKECNILTKNYLESALQQASWNGENQIIIKDTSELGFEKGFFKKDVKEFIEKLMEGDTIEFSVGKGYDPLSVKLGIQKERKRMNKKIDKLVGEGLT